MATKTSHSEPILHNMYVKNKIIENELETEEDALSLCDLPIHDDDCFDDQFDSLSKETPPFPDQDLFEFFGNSNSTTSRFSDQNIIFCGKIIEFNEPKIEDRRGKWRSESFQKPKSVDLDRILDKKTRSNSFRVSRSSFKQPPSLPTEKSRSQARKRLLLGPAKFSTEMELSEIKKRQTRLSIPAPTIIPAGEVPLDFEKDRGWDHWAVIRRSVKCSRPHLFRLLVSKAAFGCMRRPVF